MFQFIIFVIQSQSLMMNLLFRSVVVFHLMFFAFNAYGQTHKNTIFLEGVVADSITGEVLSGVHVTAQEGKIGRITDGKGLFSMELPQGKNKILVNLLGYILVEKEYNLNTSAKIKILLVPNVKQMEEVTVMAQNSKERIQGVSTGTFQMNRKELNKIPVLLGETDYFKAIQLMPGIQSTGEGNAAIYVRGGGYDQNLIILDNATVYNPSHLLGFYSVFNSDIIGGVKVIKSGIPAEFGNRLSSVLEFTTRKDIPEKLSIKGNVGLISSRIGLETPIFKGKASISFSARKIYLNTYLEAFRKTGWIKHRSILYKSGYDFFDLNATSVVQLNTKNKISIGFYKGNDVFKIKSDVIELNTKLDWGNDILSFTWNKIFNQNFYMENSIVSSKYNLGMNLNQSTYGFNLISSINDYGLKNKFIWVKNKHKITAGLVSTYHDISPNTSKAKSDSVQLNLGTVSHYHSLESGIFAGDEYEISEKLSIYLGLRYNNFIHYGPFTQLNRDDTGEVTDTLHYDSWNKIKTYGGLDLRSSLRYLLNENLSVKLSYNSNQQFLHLVNASSITFPTDFWISSSSKVKPQYGSQWAAGIFHFLKEIDIETSLEVYYKDLKNQIEFYKGFLNSMDNSAFDENLIFGKGRAYGAEILIKKTKGTFTGWIGYTLSKTEKSFKDIEAGKWFPAKYDKPNDLSVVINYNADKKWSFSALFVYSTGSTFTPIVGRYFIANNIVNEYGSYNSARLPAYHRCDVSATYQIRKTEKVDSRIIISVYNIYNRKNPFFMYPEVSGNLENFALSVSPKEVSIFPILPSISWEFKF